MLEFFQANEVLVLPSSKILTDEDVIISEMHQQPEGDLAPLINDQNMTDYAIDVELINQDRIISIEADPQSALSGALIYENLDHPEYPRAVVFHDSFGKWLHPLLPACFSRVVFVKEDDIIMDIVQEEHPDLVIQEVVERLCDPRLLTPPVAE